MNCARIRLSVETSTIFVRDGWLIIEVTDEDALRTQLVSGIGDRLLTVAEIGERTGFTRGAVREWIKRSVLAAVRVGKEYRVRESDLETLIKGGFSTNASLGKRIQRRRKRLDD